MTDREKAAYVAAFIDGEGHVGLSRIKKTGNYTREITFSNTDKALFDAVAAFCRELGFPISIYFKARALPERDQWHARVSGGVEVYKRFIESIPLQAPRKRRRLQEIIESYADRDALTLKRRKGEEIECATCKAIFYETPSRRARFCSAKCRDAAAVTRITKICEICGTSFEVIRARAQSRFCSLSCSGKSQSERMSELGKRTIASARGRRGKRFAKVFRSDDAAP